MLVVNDEQEDLLDDPAGLHDRAELLPWDVGDHVHHKRSHAVFHGLVRHQDALRPAHPEEDYYIGQRLSEGTKKICIRDLFLDWWGLAAGVSRRKSQKFDTLE